MQYKFNNVWLVLCGYALLCIKLTCTSLVPRVFSFFKMVADHHLEKRVDPGNEVEVAPFDRRHDIVHVGISLGPENVPSFVEIM